MPDVTLRGVTLAAPCRAGAGRCRVIVPVTALLPQPAALQAQAAANRIGAFFPRANLLTAR